ncbi:MAG: carboxypeptidase regulatory-like domain-containing protein [Gemmatimonas sp.]
MLSGILWALALAAVSASAQQASFAGKVLNETGEKPIANVEIILEGTTSSARSDSRGYFVISGLSAGTYSLLARHLGFEPLRTRFVLHATEKVEVDRLLTPSVTTLKGTVATTPLHYNRSSGASKCGTIIVWTK